MNKKFLRSLCQSILLVLAISACTDLSSVNDRIDELEEEFNNQQSEIAKLKTALENSKTIYDVQPLDSEDSGITGWTITFSDGTSINILNGKNGTDATTSPAPLLKVDGEGYWMVQYDHEKEAEHILDVNGNKVNALGQSGEKGKDGNHIRVSTDENGYYVFEVYHPSDPETILQSISTDYTSDKSSILKSIVRNDNNGEITFTLMDGTVFVFPLQKIVPTAIVILTTKSLVLSEDVDNIKFDFRVNPSNVLFNYNAETSECQIKMNFVNGGKALQNGSVPCTIYKIEPSKDTQGNVISGQYTVTIKDSGKNVYAYDEDVYLTLEYYDPNGDKALITSPLFNVRYDSEFPFLQNTGLPLVVINIPGNREITSKNNWTDAVEMKIYNEKGELDYEGSMQMKGRGNSTWNQPKKPYALKLNSKSKILGMKKHKRWCLLANYADRTKMRNAVAFEVSKKTGLDWTPSGQWVELVINGTHRGNYYLCEQVKIDNNRVDINELDPNATEGEAITGGYIFEIDAYFDELYKFRSSGFNYPWMFKDPDEVNTAQFNYVQKYVSDMETAIKMITTGDYESYKTYIDIESFIDWWFVYELMENPEPYYLKSTYLFKDMNGKIKMGPVWDFDWALTITSVSDYTIKNTLYYNYLFNDPTFVTTVKERWEMFKTGMDEIPQYIETIRKKLNKSQKLDKDKWGVISNGWPNYESGDYDAAIDKIKDAFIAKLGFMNERIPLL